MPEVGGMQQRELLRTECPNRLAAFDDRLDQIRRIPLRRDDVVAFGLQPGFEEFPLGGFAGSVGTFKRDEEAAPAGAVTEMGACAQAQSPQGLRRSAHQAAYAAS